MVKVLNLAVVFLIRAEMVSKESWFRSSPLLAFNQGKTDESKMYDCREDEFAIYFLKQVITDFVTKIVVDAAVAVVKKIIARIRGITNQSWKNEYELSEEIVWLLYFQLQLWLSQIFFPFVAFIALIFMYLLFRYSYFSLRLFKAKPRQSSNSSVIIIFTLTLLIGHRFLHNDLAQSYSVGNLCLYTVFDDISLES